MSEDFSVEIETLRALGEAPGHPIDPSEIAEADAMEEARLERKARHWAITRVQVFGEALRKSLVESTDSYCGTVRYCLEESFEMLDDDLRERGGRANEVRQSLAAVFQRLADRFGEKANT